MILYTDIFKPFDNKNFLAYDMIPKGYLKYISPEVLIFLILIQTHILDTLANMCLEHAYEHYLTDGIIPCIWDIGKKSTK